LAIAKGENMTKEEKVIYDGLLLAKRNAIEIKNTATNEDAYWEARKQIEIADSFFDYLIVKYGGDYTEEIDEV
jgi:hypothetical protein